LPFAACLPAVPARTGPADRSIGICEVHHPAACTLAPVVSDTAAPGWPELHQFDLPAQPWHRQFNEPTRAYGVFRMFRDLTPHQRTIQAVCERSGFKERTCQNWALTWHWHERANAWDDACHAVEDQERLDAIRAMHAVHRRAGRAAVAKAVQALGILTPEQMPPSLIARLLELGAKLERQTLIVSVEELQGIEVEESDDTEDPWERIARELDPAQTHTDL
jgi:hypothetical protein